MISKLDALEATIVIEPTKNISHFLLSEVISARFIISEVEVVRQF